MRFYEKKRKMITVDFSVFLHQDIFNANKIKAASLVCCWRSLCSGATVGERKTQKKKRVREELKIMERKLQERNE